MEQVRVAPVSIEKIESLITRKSLAFLHDIGPAARELLSGRIVWNLNSTAQGGGVAEMLQPVLAYVQSMGLDVRWVVIGGTPEFFDITKRIHNNIHGHPGDGGDLAAAERATYEMVASMNAQSFAPHVRSGDIVICHDPQTAGLIPHLVRHGCHVVWRCHIGHDQPNELTSRAWSFLVPYLRQAHRYVFTRRSYVPAQLASDRVEVIPPSIDPLSAKNQLLDPEVVRSILIASGVFDGPPAAAMPLYHRQDGSMALVRRQAEIIRTAPLHPDQPLVLQVSRWDHLKDPIGVITGFTRYLRNDSAVLMLAGPSVAAVADDPEGGAVLKEVTAAWNALPRSMRQRVQIACLPMLDREENAAIVNALQRHASVVVQKSLHEGFGLTVTEAMWKGRPVVASAVGGIQDQITDGVHGLLVCDPTDLVEFAGAVDRVLSDRLLGRRLMRNARSRVRSQYLVPRHLQQYYQLFQELLVAESQGKQTARIAG